MAENKNATFVSIQDTVSFCKKHSDDFKDIPVFNENIHELDGLANQMQATKQQLDEGTREHTEKKNASKSIAISTTVADSETGLAYFGDHRDLIIPDVLKVSITSLSRMHESNLADACRKVLNYCVEHSTDFLLYGFTQQSATKTEADIADFELKLAGTPEFKHEQSILKAKYDAHMATAKDLLVNTIDPKAKLVKRVAWPSMMNI